MTAAGPELLQSPTGSGSERPGCGRLGLFGCLAGVVVLAVVLIFGYSSLRRGVWTAAERASDRVTACLPFEIDSRERARTLDNLERFFPELEKLSDPYPVIGGFMRRVTDGFADGRLSVAEVAELNEYLESVGETPQEEPTRAPEAPPSPAAAEAPAAGGR